MAKETDGQGRTTMNEADLEYLRNINTRPGPNAGRSIDPTKPGPDADRIASRLRGQSDTLPREHQDPSKWPTRETVERAHALVQSDAEPECQRALKHAKGYIESSIFNVPSKEKTDEILSEIDTALASDAEPIAWREALEQQLSDLVELARDTRSDKGRPAQWTHPVGSLVSEFAKRIASLRSDAQSDAEPALPQTLRDAAENLLIAIGMGWDLNGCAENLRAALAQPNAEPDASAGIAELRERCVEVQGLAFQWMERHDKVVGFIRKNYPAVTMPNLPFPSPVSRSDASAGLIEAAEWHEKQIAFYRDQCRKADADLNIDAVGRYDAKRAWHESSAKYFRARAADRSDAERDFESKPIGYRVYNAPPDRGEPADYIPIGGAGNGA